MNLEFLNTATAKELEQFKAVCCTVRAGDG